MECPSCGEENKPDAVFCMSCGAPLPDVPFSQLKKEEDVRPRESAAQPSGAQAGTGAGGQGVQAASPGGFILGAETVQPQAPAKPESPAAQPAAPAPTERQMTPTAATTPIPQAGVPGAAPVPTQAPAPQPQAEGPIPAPPAPAPAAPPAPPAAGARSVVEEIGGEPETPPAAPEQAAPKQAAPPPQAPAAPAQAAAADTRMAPPIPASKVETQAQTPPSQTPAPQITPPAAGPPSKEEYYIPPEVDYDVAALREKPVEAEPQPVLPEQVPPTLPPSLDSTQEVAAIIAAGAAAGAAKERRTVCPECYAPNPEGNIYCQECGSALPLTTGRQPDAARTAPGKPPAGQTAVLASASQQGVAAQPAYASQLPKARKAYSDKAFGVADILALFAAGAAAVAIALSYALESFAWKKGVDIAMFSHQGAYTQGRTDLLGGPGLLPYEGAEFFTVGLVVAVGLALALIFLAVRVGRGPMYILSGCILLLPVAYLFFQAVLPLRQMGIEVDPSVGLSGIFFGNAAAPGAGPPLWLITGAGVLLVLAGFMAPPRGWGRLFTFMLCFSIVLGIAFFCAACFNWNLFISEPAALTAWTAKPLTSAFSSSWVPLL
jgi:hypothetical protein